MRLNVLLVAGGGFQGQGLADAIRQAPGTRVIIADSVPDNIGRFVADRYYVAPSLSNEREFQEFITTLVKEERVDLVLPCTNRELVALARMRNRLSALGVLDTLLDKLAFHRELLATGIPTQRPVELSAEAPLPLFGKPRAGWGGVDTHVVRTVDDLRNLDLEGLSVSHCWVPWLQHFEEISADFAIGFGHQLSPITLRRRVRTSGGFAVISDSILDDSLNQVVGEVAHWLISRGGIGIFNVQVLRTQEGALYVSDVNPRHGTSGGHAAGEGNHLVAFITRGAVPDHRRPVRTVRTLGQRVIPLVSEEQWKGVVFDLDDTLIDHKRWMMDKLLLAGTALVSVLEPERLARVAYAIVEEGPHDRLIDVLADRLGAPDLRDKLLQAYREATPAQASVFPDVYDVLSELRRSGVRIALLTDNPPESQRAKLRAMPGIEELFDAVVFTREHGGEKPLEAGFRVVAERLGLPPSSLLMVGDNPGRDALGAIDAGFGGCMLVTRPGTRLHVNEALLAQIAPEVSMRIWTDKDLRALPFVCGIKAK
jgi:HAD superfamily hydrolase (TIGR01549 family)